MTAWIRQHRESLLFRMPWHLESPVPTRAALLGLKLTVCDSTLSAEDRGLDQVEDPPLDDRCPVCQGAFARGDAAVPAAPDVPERRTGA